MKVKLYPYLFCVISLFIHPLAKAQLRAFDQFSVKAAYFGELISHAGLKVGIETPLRLKEKPRKRFTKEKYKLLAANVGFYVHSRNHVGAFLNIEYGTRGITSDGFLSECWVGLGYFRSFLAAPTYEVNDQGQVRRVPLAGRGSLMLSLSAGLGQDLSRKTHWPITWVIKPTLFFQIPYNNALLPQLGIEASITYPINISF
ncbi:MAG: hypothetical protein ACFB0B_00570 [Thermonemataceae bacterium]